MPAKHGMLLIELYGIETGVRILKTGIAKDLLIELYGIETQTGTQCGILPFSFNRTIWN